MIYDSEQGKVVVALTGDSMNTRSLRRFEEPAFQRLLTVMRDADATVVNAEMLFHEFEMSWNYTGASSYQVSHPRNLHDLKWMGADVVTTATNHAFDYGERGFLTTLRHCEEAGLLQAGGGTHLGAARAPAYLDTKGGRVAVMAATSTFTDVSRAGPGRADFQGKPGVSTLRHEVTHHVPRTLVDALRDAKEELGYAARERSRRRQRGATGAEADEGRVRFLGGAFHADDGDGYRLTSRCYPDDLADIGRWIRGAKKQADWVVFGIHCHESGISDEWHGQGGMTPPDFLVEFAHHAIDCGADAVASHGTHFLRGVEVYQGRPIFYSLGNFVFHNETVQWLPQPAYEGFGLGDEDTPGDWGWGRSQGGKHGHAGNPVFYRSALAECRFDQGGGSEVWLHPVDLGFGKPIGQRGRPVLADDEVAGEVLDWLQRVSAPYGTKIEVEGTKGVIRL